MSVFWITASLAVAVDQITKFIAMRQEMVVFNSGVSWGVRLFNGQETAISLIFLLVFFWWWKKQSAQNWLSQASWGFLLGSGSSNVLDRFLYGGAVADWWRWETLGFINNLADSLIFLAVIGIIIGEFNIKQWKK